jgi:homoserine/homoserine lactone efflux protein
MDLQTLLAFAVMSTAFNVTPGAAVLKVVGDSMSNGWRRSQMSVAGVLVCNFMYCMIAAVGLGAVILASPKLFDVIKWLGVAYLIWIGVTSIYGAISAQDAELLATTKASGPALFRSTFVLQAANPKNVIFSTAVLPVFAGNAEGAVFNFLVLGVLAAILEYPVLTLYAIAGERVARLATRASSRRLFQMASGVAVIGAAALVARTSLQNR